MLHPKKDSFPPILLKIHFLAGGGREEVASFTYITGKSQHFLTSTVRCKRGGSLPFERQTFIIISSNVMTDKLPHWNLSLYTNSPNKEVLKIRCIRNTPEQTLLLRLMAKSTTQSAKRLTKHKRNRQQTKRKNRIDRTDFSGSALHRWKSMMKGIISSVSLSFFPKRRDIRESG